MLNEALPGDIIQTVNERGPYHGMIFQDEMKMESQDLTILVVV